MSPVLTARIVCWAPVWASFAFSTSRSTGTCVVTIVTAAKATAASP